MAYNVISYKKINRNTKKIEIADFIIEMTKNRPKVGSRNRDLLNFCIGMAYIGWYMVNPYVQAVQNMCAKGG